MIMLIKQKERSNKSRFEFRRVAREVTREFYDIPEDNIALIAYQTQNSSTGSADEPGRRTNTKQGAACGVLSLCLASTSTEEQGTHFDNDFNHVITFLFVKPDSQGQGVGRQLVQTAVTLMKAHAPQRPIRVESAIGAADFFQIMGFVRTHEPYQPACAGCRLFRMIVNMEYRMCTLSKS